MFFQVESGPFVSEVVLLAVLVLLSQVPSWYFYGLDLVLDSFDQFFNTVETFLVVFVQKHQVIARFLLELFADQHSVYKQGGIS